MIRHLSPWLLAVLLSSVLHAGLAWATLGMTFAWAPPPPVVFPVELAPREEPAPPITRPERRAPPAPRPVVLPAVPPKPLPEPSRPVESTAIVDRANVEPTAVTIEEKRRPPVTPLTIDQPDVPRREPAPTRPDDGAPAIAIESPAPSLERRPRVSTQAEVAAADPRPPVALLAPPAAISAAPSTPSPSVPSGPSVASIPKDAGDGTATARPRGGYQVVPTYPATARRLGIEGTTLLRVHVTADGRVGDIQIEKSAGHRDLDRAATDAVRRWRFEPARKGNEAVAVWVLLPVEFHLTP